MSGDESALIQLGAVGAPFGVRGWIKLRSDTEPPERLFDHAVWSLGLNGSWRKYTLQSSGHSAGQLTAKLAGVEDRDAAAELRGAAIYVARSELPKRAANEYYRADLIGCEVQTHTGVSLGRVENFVETPAYSVMVVQGKREHWVPAEPHRIRSVDLVARRVVVNWDELAE
jgi:16S rRNA processing protein RimM